MSRKYLHKTVGGAVDHFRKIFGLGKIPESTMPSKHEVCHAMTGFGITVGDEERVAIYDRVLNRGWHDRECDSYDYLKTYQDKPVTMNYLKSEYGVKWVRESIIDHFTDSNYKIAIDSIYHTKEFSKIQVATNPISNEEIKEHLELALKLEERIKRKTGKYFYEMDEKEVRKLPMKLFDIVQEATKIKHKHLTKSHVNNIMEQRSVVEMNRRAEELGLEEMPLFCEPWRGSYSFLSR